MIFGARKCERMLEFSTASIYYLAGGIGIDWHAVVSTDDCTSSPRMYVLLHTVQYLLSYVHYLRAEIAYRFTISKQIYFLAPCFVSIVNSFCIAFVERNEVCTMKKIDSVYV